MLYNIRDYQDGRTDTEALQAVFDDIGNDSMPEINLDYAHLKIDRAITYKPTTGDQSFLLDRGAITQSNDSENIITLDPIYQNMKIDGSSSEDNASRYLHRFNVNRVNFEGGKNQLVMGIQRLTNIQGCRFLRGKRAILGIWNQAAIIENNQFRFNYVDDVVLRTGIPDTARMASLGVNDNDPDDEKWFSNGNWANSQSNICTLNSNHSFGRPGQLCQITLLGVDQTTMNAHIFEGADPKYCLYMDSLGATVVHQAKIHGWFETGNPSVTEALVYIKNYNQVVFDRFYSQKLGNKLVHVEGNNTELIFEHMPYVNFSQGKCFSSNPNIKWVFNHPRQGAENFAVRGIWDGAVPKNISVLEGNDITACGSRGISLMSRPAYKSGQEGIIINDNAIDIRHPSWIWRGTKQYNF